MTHGIRKVVARMVPLIVAGMAAFLIATTAAICAPFEVGSPPHPVTALSSIPQQLAEEGFLAERMRKLQEAKIDQVAADIKNNPKLLDDPKYLAAHPKLAGYLEKHPDAKDKIKQDPTAFFQHLKEESRNGIGG